MMELNPKINKALLDINFIKRYEFLSNSFDNIKTPLKERLHYFDGELIIKSINQLEYAVQFETKEKFFKVQEQQVKYLAASYEASKLKRSRAAGYLTLAAVVKCLQAAT